MLYVRSAARWRRPPSQALGIDPSHPLAEELRFFVSFGAGVAFDHVNGALGNRNGSPTIEPYAGEARGGKINSGSSDYYEFAHRPNTEILGDITLAWRGVIATGSAYRHFAGKHSGGGGTNCPFDFRTDNAASPKVSLVRSSGATFSQFDSTSTIPLATPTTVEVAKLSDLGATPSIYIGGADAGSTTSGVSGTATGSGSPLRIGRRADGAVQQNGVTEYLVGWARRLSAAELREFRDAPYALLRAVPRRVYFLGGGAPTLTIADATHAHAADALTLTQVHALDVAEALHGHSAEALTLAVGAVLTTADAAHGHLVDSPTLTQAHALAIAEALHAQTAESVVLTQAHLLAIADAAHVHQAEGLTLGATGMLAIADALHPHLADALVLGQAHILAISDAAHAHLVDVLSLALPGAVWVGDRVLYIQAERRVLAIVAESRWLAIAAERRLLTIH